MPQLSKPTTLRAIGKDEDGNEYNIALTTTGPDEEIIVEYNRDQDGARCYEETNTARYRIREDAEHRLFLEEIDS